MSWGSKFVKKFTSGITNSIKNTVKNAMHGRISRHAVHAILNVVTLGAYEFVAQMGHEEWKAFKHLIVPDMRRNRELMLNGSLTPRRIIYGRCRVGNQMCYAITAGGTNEYLHVIAIFAGHQVESVDEIWLDDTLITDSKYTDKVWYTIYDGTQTAACAEMMAASNLWTADHKLLGCTYGYFKLLFNESIYPSGLPTIKAVIRGKNDIYDPRTGLTGYTANAALCSYDYMRLSVNLGGMGCAADEVDTASVITAANRCDELVDTLAGTEPRYSCNGSIDIEGTATSILQQIMQSMDGDAVYDNGKWSIYAAGPTTPQTTIIDESWLNGGISFQTGASKNDRINTVTGSYINPDDHWATADFPTMVIQDYVDEDQEELALDLPLNFCTSGYQAQRQARLAIEMSRRGMVLNYPCNMRGYAVKVNEVYRINNTLMGWTEKLFKIISWSFAPTGGVDLTLVEYDAGIYNASITDLKALTVPLQTTLPSVWFVSSPVDLDITEELYATVTIASYKSKLTLTWDATQASATTFDIALDGVIVQNVPTTTYTIWDMAPGWYDVSVRSRNALGAVSDWLTINQQVAGKDAPPANITGLQAELTRGQMRIYWAAGTEVDIAGYELQLGTTWDDPGNKVLVQNYAGTSYAWTPDRTGTISILAKAVDTSGNYSTTATRLDYTISGPGTVSTLTQQVIYNIVELKWSAATAGSFPIDYYEVWKGNTFATAELLGRKYSTFDLLQETVAGTYKYWIRAVDVAGLAGAETGVYAAVSQPPDYVLIDQQNLVFEECALVNALIENGQVVIPINTTISFENHFINNPDTTLDPWSTPQDQIDDGYPLYGQPAPATASIERVIDYGAVIPSSKLTMSVTRTALAGNVTFTPEILVGTGVTADNSSVKADSTTITADADITWVSLGNNYEASANNFRFVKYRLAATTADGGISTIQQISIKLDVKRRTLVTNTINVIDTTGDGTEVTFASLGIAPVDIVGIVAEAPYTGNASNDPIKALVNLVDAPNPTSFKVLCWNKSGTRVVVNGVTATITYI